MSAVHVVVGCAVVIRGIWGFADIARYLRAGRAQPEVTRRRPKTWQLLFDAVVPFMVGVILLANARDDPAAQRVLTVTAVVLLIWLTLEETVSWLRSRRERRASASGG